MWFNHHHLCDNLGIDLKGPCIPQSQKDWKDTWNHIKYYFSWNRIKDAEDLFDIVFEISIDGMKDEIKYKYNEKELNFKVWAKYILNKLWDNTIGNLVDWYHIYRNRWRNGFYDGETFSLDYTTAVYLYERVKRFREKAKQYIKIGLDQYTEEELKDEHNGLHWYTIPTIKLKDIDECKDNFNHWFNIRDTKYSPDWMYTIVQEKLCLDDCIKVILEYLEKYLKSENGQYLFKENYKEVYDLSISDINEQINKANKEHPDHMFWYELEDHLAKGYLSYAFQIYGIIIRSMWW